MQVITDRQKAAPLFENFKWNYMPQSILDGYHGEVWVDDPDQPNLAMLYLPALNFSIVGGDPSHQAAEAFISGINKRSFLMFADQYDGWNELGKKFHDVAFFEVTRYAFTSENLDLDHLKSLRDRDLGDLSLKGLDLGMVEQLISEKSELSEDHFINFSSAEAFIEKGFGFAILEDERVVSVATTFVVCDGGIEIQINTRKKYEGRGLGTVVATALIVESLERDLDPSWDAATERSAGLAKKLGYTKQGEYPMYIVFGSKLLVKLLLIFRKIMGRDKKKGK
jgi:hypothetical protein